MPPTWHGAETLTPPTWHAAETLAGKHHLHHLIARLGCGPARDTTYRLGDGLRHLADLECVGVPLKQTAIVRAVARTHDGQWLLHTSCTRCGLQHMHGAGEAAAPTFGQHYPPCGGEPYHLRLD